MSQLISEHCGYNTLRTAIFSKTYGVEMLICPYKDYSTLNRWQANWVFLSVIYYCVMMHLLPGKKVRYAPDYGKMSEVHPVRSKGLGCPLQRSV
jgi:hypothetical protein